MNPKSEHQKLILKMNSKKGATKIITNNNKF